jgi:hypothetical protein
MATRITVSRSEKTARYWPSAPPRKRNQTISIPMPARPESAIAAAVMASAWRAPEAGGAPSEGAAGGGASAAGARRAASTIAVTPAARLRDAETIWVRHSPSEGISVKSVRKQPSAAPAVLRP